MICIFYSSLIHIQFSVAMIRSNIIKIIGLYCIHNKKNYKQIIDLFIIYYIYCYLFIVLLLCIFVAAATYAAFEIIVMWLMKKIILFINEHKIYIAINTINNNQILITNCHAFFFHCQNGFDCFENVGQEQCKKIGQNLYQIFFINYFLFRIHEAFKNTLRVEKKLLKLTLFTRNQTSPTEALSMT